MATKMSSPQEIAAILGFDETCVISRFKKIPGPVLMLSHSDCDAHTARHLFARGLIKISYACALTPLGREVATVLEKETP